MNKIARNVLSLLLVFMLLFTVIPAGYAHDDLTVSVSSEGLKVNIYGQTIAETFVSLALDRLADGDKMYADQVRSDKDGNYQFEFEIDPGVYSALVSSNGIQKQREIFIKDKGKAGIATVRVEGAEKTLLPQTKIEIIDGESQLIDVILEALDKGGLTYEVHKSGLLDVIEGEKDWQWLVSSKGGMVPGYAPLRDGDEIVMVRGHIMDPTITRLTLSASEIDLSDDFTVTLEKYVDGNWFPVKDVPLVFGRDEENTDENGQVIFTARERGRFEVHAATEGNLIRPVPAVIEVKFDSPNQPGPGEIDDDDKTVYIRIEGYDKTIVKRTRIKVSLFDLNPLLSKGTGQTAKPSGNWGVDRFKRPTHAHAIAQILEKRSIDYDFQDYGWGLYIAMIGGEREFDHAGMSGWMYRVNGEMPSIGCQGLDLRNDDEIVWYYGPYGFDQIYIEMKIDNTDVDIDEEVTVHLDGYFGGFSTNIRDLEGATILVNDKEYELDGEVVKTNKNGDAILSFDKKGNYTISALRYKTKGGMNEYIETVRPVPEVIRVGQDGGSSSEERISNIKYKDMYKIILDKKSNERDILKAVSDAKDVFEEDHKNVADEQGAKNAIKDAEDMVKIIKKASERIETEKGIESILKETNTVIDLTSKALQYLKDEGYQSKATKVFQDFVHNSLILLGQVDDDNLFRHQVESIVDKAITISKKLPSKQEKILIDSMLKSIDDMVQKSGIYEISVDRPKGEDKKGLIEIKNGNIEKTIEKTINRVKIVEDVIKDKKFKLNRALKKVLIVKTEKLYGNAVDVMFRSDVLSGKNGNELDTIEIYTPISDIEIPSKFIKRHMQNSDITFSIRKVATDELEKYKDIIPPKAEVVDISLNLDDFPIQNPKTPVYVSLPYGEKPKDDKNLTAVCVNENGDTEVIGGQYDSKAKKIKFLTNHFSLYFAEERPKQFKDLSETPWAREAIETMASKGVITGKSQELFGPNDSLTRAEFAALVTRVLKVTAESKKLPFEDVDLDKWYGQYVAKAYENGLMSGKGHAIFDPDGYITRQELSKIIAEVLTKLGYFPAEENTLSAFSDEDDIAKWARTSMALTLREGIITGVTEKELKPTAKVTRAQVAVMLHRLYKVIFE